MRSVPSAVAPVSSSADLEARMRGAERLPQLLARQSTRKVGLGQGTGKLLRDRQLGASSQLGGGHTTGGGRTLSNSSSALLTSSSAELASQRCTRRSDARKS